MFLHCKGPYCPSQVCTSCKKSRRTRNVMRGPGGWLLKSVGIFDTCRKRCPMGRHSPPSAVMPGLEIMSFSDRPIADPYGGSGASLDHLSMKSATSAREMARPKRGKCPGTRQFPICRGCIVTVRGKNNRRKDISEVNHNHPSKLGIIQQISLPASDTIPNQLAIVCPTFSSHVVKGQNPHHRQSACRAR